MQVQKKAKKRSKKDKEVEVKRSKWSWKNGLKIPNIAFFSVSFIFNNRRKTWTFIVKFQRVFKTSKHFFYFERSKKWVRYEKLETNYRLGRWLNNVLSGDYRTIRTFRSNNLVRILYVEHREQNLCSNLQLCSKLAKIAFFYKKSFYQRKTFILNFCLQNKYFLISRTYDEIIRIWML